MAKRKSRKMRVGRFPYARVLFWFLLIVETLWLGAFIWAARSPFPSKIVENARDRWREHSDNKELEELLAGKSDIQK